MKAKVETPFPGRPDAEALSRTVAAGEVIDGDLAAYAVGAGLAVEIHDQSDAAEDGGGAPDLSKLTRSELDALARDRGVDITSARTKADVISLLGAAG